MDQLKGFIDEDQAQINRQNDLIIPKELKSPLKIARQNMLVRKINAEISRKSKYEWSMPEIRKEAIRVSEERQIRDKLGDPELNSMIRKMVASRLLNQVFNKKKEQ